MHQKYFSSYLSITNNEFEAVEKSKEYDKYLKRIESIVRRKDEQDLSPAKYMKLQRKYKDSVKKLAKQEVLTEIMSANNILYERIEAVRNRKP